MYYDLSEFDFEIISSEIQRIAIATDFNGIKLIDGVKSNLSKDIQLNIPIINHVNDVAEYKEKNPDSRIL